MRTLSKVYKRGYDEFVAELVGDKYGISKAKADFIKLDILDEDGLAAWEANSGASELWIAATSIRDDTNPKFRQAVIENLKRGCTVTYLLHANEFGVTGSFARFKKRLQNELTVADGTVHAIPLTDDQVQWMAASFVISNPRAAMNSASGDQASGYTILFHGEYVYGIRMNDSELFNRADLLQNFIDARYPEWKKYTVAFPKPASILKSQEATIDETTRL